MKSKIPHKAILGRVAVVLVVIICAMCIIVALFGVLVAGKRYKAKSKRIKQNETKNKIG